MTLSPRKIIKSESGFSMIETIVAIGVILTGLISVMALLSQGFRSVRVASDRLVASNLTQEAIEVVINIRDTNWIADQGWLTNIPFTTTGIVNYNSTDVNIVAPSSFCINLVGGVYIHGAPPCNTLFERHVEIIDRNEDIDGNSVDYIEVRAIVEWTQGSITRTVTAVDHLYDWR